jgi:hypothetical protein
MAAVRDLCTSGPTLVSEGPETFSPLGMTLLLGKAPVSGAWPGCHRATQPWPKDYLTPPAELKGNKLFMSTVVAEERDQGNQKHCLFCGLGYYYRPGNCKEHLDKLLTKDTLGHSRAVQVCVPYAEHTERFEAILEEARKRSGEDKATKNASGKRSLEQMGGEDYPVDVDRLNTSRAG